MKELENYLLMKEAQVNDEMDKTAQTETQLLQLQDKLKKTELKLR